MRNNNNDNNNNKEAERNEDSKENKNGEGNSLDVPYEMNNNICLMKKKTLVLS